MNTDFVYVVVKSEYRAYQQKSLSNVKEKPIRYVLYCEDLISDHYHACDNQNHGTEVLYFLVCRHSYNIVAAPAPESAATTTLMISRISCPQFTFTFIALKV